jgi:hypothetical protein
MKALFLILIFCFFGEFARAQQLHPFKETYDQVLEPNYASTNYNNTSIKWWEGWGPILQSYLNMYQATGDKAYLNRFIKHTYGIQLRKGTNEKSTVFLVNNDGGLYCTSARVRLKEEIPVPDFVFKPDYELMPLSEVKKFVQTNSHLPNIPSEKEIREDGLSLEEMQLKLLQKVEELTLYVIELDEKNKVLEEAVKTLKTK